MRTKTLLLTAALVAAGVASSMAQSSNVYSLNVVGYINVSLTNGFNIVANQLDADGTGTNNTIVGVFSNSLPSGSFVYKFSAGGFNNSYGYSTRAGWSGNASLNPGEAVFVSVPSATNVTLVGQVLQGSLTNKNVTPGFSLVSSIAPISGPIDGTGNGGLNYTPVTGDFVYLFNTATQQYTPYGYGRAGWSPSDPTIPVGTGFFLDTTQSTWVQNFSVQ